MAVYVFTGKLGGGKTLCSVGRIKEKLQVGCRVATNLDIDLKAMFGRSAKDIDIVRIPDKPKIQHMKQIGVGNTSYDESKNGLLVLDECGTWFNSRNWNDKDRKPVNEWFLHARKLGWDVILIIQDIKLLDSQARDALAEHTVFCKRLDRISIPLIGSLYKLITGYRLGGPRVHVAKAVYGISITDLVADRWVYRGTGLFAAYDTKQLFLEDYPHETHSLLTPWHLIGRYARPRDKDFYMRMTKIYWKRFQGPAALFTGAALGAICGLLLVPTFSHPAQAVEQVVQVVEELESDIQKEFDEVEQTEPPTPINQVFAGFRISSYIQSKDSIHYSISDGINSYTAAQLRAMRYYVQDVSNCEITISRLETPTDRTHIFAPGCIPRPYDHPMYDLDNLPMVQEFAGTAPIRSF